MRGERDYLIIRGERERDNYLMSNGGRERERDYLVINEGRERLFSD